MRVWAFRSGSVSARYLHADAQIRSHAATLALSPRPAHQFPAAVWADGVHLFGAIRAKRAFEAADESRCFRVKFIRTFFTGSFHFQRHSRWVHSNSVQTVLTL
jgi:hypothetical protein